MSIPAQIKGTPLCFFNQVHNGNEFNYVLVDLNGHNYEYLVGINGQPLEV